MESVFSMDLLERLGMRPEDEELCAVISDPLGHAERQSGRRVLKTHLPFEFLPADLPTRCKERLTFNNRHSIQMCEIQVIYVARNPKDTAVSFYHHNRTVPGHGFQGTFAQFLQFFREGLHPFGSYWHHLRSGWDRRSLPGLTFLWYEEMKADTVGVIKQLSGFLAHPLTQQQVTTSSSGNTSSAEDLQ